MQTIAYILKIIHGAAKMSESSIKSMTVGWIGAGRMGYAMAKLLLDAGADVTVYNRTRAKAEPLTESGAKIVDHPSELADRDVVFTMVSGPDDLINVLTGENGLLSGEANPKMLVDCSSVSEEASAQARKICADRGMDMLAAPVSGNAKVVKKGKLTIVASGPRDSYDKAEPFLEAMGRGSTYVGEGELARMVKICHNLMLGVYTQCMAEILVLAEKGGVSRSALMHFLNDSVMGSMFSNYKTNSVVNLDMTPTFTPVLLKKDLNLGLDAAKKLGMELPVIELTRDIVQKSIDAGHVDNDFMILLQEHAKASGLDITPENVEVGDGL
jgi:3-hydroxyisobutyrate dehydrogenase